MLPSVCFAWTIIIFCYKWSNHYYHHWPSVFSIILFICHELRRHTVVETPVKTWQQTPTTPLRAILTSEATAKGSDHTALFWQFLCSHCLGGDKQPPSQPQPTTAQTNYWTGRPCIHCGPCNRTCPAFYLLLIHEMAITTKPSESGERGMM